MNLQDRFVNVENMMEEELKTIQKYYCSLSEHTKKEENLQQCHSIDGAHESHDLKKHIEQE